MLHRHGRVSVTIFIPMHSRLYSTPFATSCLFPVQQYNSISAVLLQLLSLFSRPPFLTSSGPPPCQAERGLADRAWGARRGKCSNSSGPRTEGFGGCEAPSGWFGKPREFPGPGDWHGNSISGDSNANLYPA